MGPRCGRCVARSSRVPSADCCSINAERTGVDQVARGQADWPYRACPPTRNSRFPCRAPGKRQTARRAAAPSLTSAERQRPTAGLWRDVSAARCCGGEQPFMSERLALRDGASANRVVRDRGRPSRSSLDGCTWAVAGISHPHQPKGGKPWQPPILRETLQSLTAESSPELPGHGLERPSPRS